MSGSFFPMIARMRYINRWGLMRNTDTENIQEHSHMVAVLSHALAVIQNRYFGPQIDPGQAAVAALYDAVCDTLEAGENYPGWAKGDYPTRRDAEMGEAAGELFVAEEEGEIIGTMMLREEQERNARSAPWQQPLEEQEQLTIYTFAVRPDCRGGGVGRALLGYAEAWAKAQGKRALRLDVHEINTPAIKLYESCGFRYIATVDLGYGAYGLKWFRLYEKLL